MTGKRDRADALRERLAGDDERTETEADEKGSEQAEGEESIKERTNVNMYLPDEQVNRLRAKYSELNAKANLEHGRDIEKNREFYPAVIEAALEGEEIEDVLDL